MTLPDFYDRLLKIDGSLSEGEMRLLLQGALDHISVTARVPLVHVQVPKGLTKTVPEVVTAGEPLRRFLTVPPEAAHASPSLVVTLVPGDDFVTVAGAEVAFRLVCEGTAPTVPADASEAPGATWEVPWGECALDYIANEQLADSQPMRSRIAYARFRERLVTIKQDARRFADVERIAPFTDATIREH